MGIYIEINLLNVIHPKPGLEFDHIWRRIGAMYSSLDHVQDDDILPNCIPLGLQLLQLPLLGNVGDRLQGDAAGYDCHGYLGIGV